MNIDTTYILIPEAVLRDSGSLTLPFKIVIRLFESAFIHLNGFFFNISYFLCLLQSANLVFLPFPLQ